MVSSTAPSTLNIYLGVQVRALENKRSSLLVRRGMTRVPGVGISSASPSLENKEEHESDAALPSPEDRDRWGRKLVTRKMGMSFVLRGQVGDGDECCPSSRAGKTLCHQPSFLLLSSLGGAAVSTPHPHSSAFPDNHRRLQEAFEGIPLSSLRMS